MSREHLEAIVAEAKLTPVQLEEIRSANTETGWDLYQSMIGEEDPWKDTGEPYKPVEVDYWLE